MLGKVFFYEDRANLLRIYFIRSLGKQYQDCVSVFFTGFQPEYNATIYLQL